MNAPGRGRVQNAAAACSCGCDQLIPDSEVVRDAHGRPYAPEHLYELRDAS